MNSQSRYLFAAALLALAAVSTPAWSQGSNFYAGLGLGRASADGICALAAGSSCDESSTSYKLFGGYQINQNWAAEAGWVNLGTAKATLPAGGGSFDADAKGFEFLGIGAYPLNPQWSVYGKLGLFRWSTDFKDGTGGGNSSKANGIDLTYGAGVRWDFAKNIAVRAEFQQYRDVGDLSTTGQSNIDVWGISALFKF